MLTHTDIKNLVLNFILALQTFPDACRLPSLNGRRSLFGDLLRFNSVVDLDAFEIRSVTYLIKEVINNALAQKIWNIVRNLVVESTLPLRLQLNLD